MLEQETDTILRVITKRTIGSRDRITLGEVMESDIPRGIKAYLRADVIRSIERDFERAPSLTRVDRREPGFDGFIRQLLRTLADNFTFQRDDFQGALENAVHFVENYLCRPQWTLAGFLLQERNSSTVRDIIFRLDYFVDYGYFPKLIERSLRPDSVEPVRLDHFRSLLTRIDDQVVRQHNGKELALLTKPIFDFLLLTDAAPHLPIPISPLLVFFDDKKMNIMREYIESIAKIRTTNELSLNDLTTIIEDLYSGQPVPPSGVPAPSEIPEPPAGEATTEKTGTSPPAATGRTVGGSASLMESARKNIPLSLTFPGLTDKPEVTTPESRNLPDLNEIISGEMKDRFVREIFKDDTGYFTEIMTALNNLRTLEEASAYLEELYELNGLELARAEVKEFDDTIRRRYTDETRGGA